MRDPHRDGRVVPEGVNSHTFEPALSVAAVMAIADLVFRNGLFLEEPTLQMTNANLKPGAQVVSLGEQTFDPKQSASIVPDRMSGLSPSRAALT